MHKMYGNIKKSRNLFSSELLLSTTNGNLGHSPGGTKDSSPTAALLNLVSLRTLALLAVSEPVFTPLNFTLGLLM